METYVGSMSKKLWEDAGEKKMRYIRTYQVSGRLQRQIPHIVYVAEQLFNQAIM